MADLGVLKKDALIQINSQPYRILESQHSKQARGSAVVRVKLKNLIDGSVRQETFQGSDKIESANVQKVDMQYLYREGSTLHLMDTNSFAQEQVEAAMIGDATKFLIEGMNVMALHYNGRIIGLELPKKLSVKIAKTEPAVRGDTSKAALKKAELENGTIVDVPLFIGPGVVVKIDTRDGKYVERG